MPHPLLIVSKIDVKELWTWLNLYLRLLEELSEKARKAPADKLDGKYLGELRIAERAFNDFMDLFNVVADDQTGASLLTWLDEHYKKEGGAELWQKMKIRRDKVADTLSGLIESNDRILTAYKNYCDNLKDPRKLGFAL